MVLVFLTELLIGSIKFVSQRMGRPASTDPALADVRPQILSYGKFSAPNAMTKQNNPNSKLIDTATVDKYSHLAFCFSHFTSILEAPPARISSNAGANPFSRLHA
jgi:hypothetical protein